MLGTSAFCFTTVHARCVTLEPSGHVIRHQNCLLSDPPGNAFTLRYGRSVRVGPFRCTSRRVGMQCLVVRNGHGFLLSRKRLKTF
jgi:hypothetical protein